jgi:hypothetical protein
MIAQWFAADVAGEWWFGGSLWGEGLQNRILGQERVVGVEVEVCLKN